MFALFALHRLLRQASLLLCLLAGTAAWAAPADEHLQEIVQVQFAATVQGPWQQVQLPDTWAARGLKAPGMGVYRARFMLEAAPAGMWAMQLQRVSTRHQVRVNGELVHDSMLPGNIVQRRPVPAMVSVPPALLHVGENLIEITVDNGQRAGLSTLVVGPVESVESAYLWGYHRSITLPQLLNVASCGVGLFMLMLWWRRRSELALGSFSLLGILTSVRNFSYYEVGNSLPLPLTDWLYFAAQVASVVLLGLFASAVAGRRLRGFVPALWGIGGALLLFGAAAAFTGQLNLARAVGYPLLIALALPSVWLVARRAREMRAGALLGLLLGLLAVLGSGVHDYLYQQGLLSVMHAYWLPYTVPVALTAFSAVLMHRVVGALEQVEELNLTLEQRVRERTRDLQAANAAKTRFIAAASHDLRQPVVTIGLLVGLLREQIASASLRSMMDRVNEAVAALESLLRGLLDLSRFDAGSVKPRLQAVPMQPLFDAIAAHEAEAARLKGLRLRFRPTDVSVHSDPVLLEQIVRNLVNNAVRYTDRGGVLVALRRRGAGHVLLQVWDTGWGISEAQHEAVFEEFVQLGTSRDRVRGLGLGLALVKRAAQLLDHPLRLRSVLHKGSCFSLELPVTTAPTAAETVAEPTAQPLAGLHIALVEDEASVREAMDLQLQRWGAQVSAFDGLLTLDRSLGGLSAGSTTRPWDLLVTDNRLPGGANSMVVIERVRRACGPLPALVVTGDTSPRDIATLTDSGVPVLHKPFRAVELLAAIEATRASVRA